jgi:hypothetical protein
MLSDMVDEIAEQALKLGGQVAGTLAWFKAHTRLGEDDGDNVPDTRRMIEQLKHDHESIMETLRADIGATEDRYNDAATSNLLQEMSDKHHKMAWTLRMIPQESALDWAVSQAFWAGRIGGPENASQRGEERRHAPAQTPLALATANRPQWVMAVTYGDSRVVGVSLCAAKLPSKTSVSGRAGGDGDAQMAQLEQRGTMNFLSRLRA